MSDSPTENGANPPAGGEGAQQQPAKMLILGQFIRDLSFENIVAQKGVQGEVTPDVQVQVNLDAKKRPADHQYEIVLKFNIESRNKADKSPLFLLEIEYGGIFHVENVPESQLHAFLLIECPRMLFPFARRIVSDVSRDGGFPPLNLENVDFLALYRQEIARRVQQQKEAGEQPAKPS